jgi:hypothetical protein
MEARGADEGGILKRQEAVDRCDKSDFRAAISSILSSHFSFFFGGNTNSILMKKNKMLILKIM